MTHANLTVTQLRDLLREYGIRGYSGKNKVELIMMVERAGIEHQVAKSPQLPYSKQANISTSIIKDISPITLNISSETTIIYHQIKSHLLFPLIEDTSENNIDAHDARFILDELLVDYKHNLTCNTQILFVDSTIEFNLFNGSSYHLRNMQITVPDIVTRGHTTFQHWIQTGKYFSYLYRFTKLDGTTGYLCVLHEETPDHNNQQMTLLAILI